LPQTIRLKFSVVIPLYNKEKYVRQAIDSILAQSFRDFEILVIDDGSTDESLNVAQSFRESVRIISHERNRGLSAARNTGIREAKGDFVVFLDADDYWKPEFLEAINQLTEQFPQASLFATAYEEVYPNHTIKPKVMLGEVSDLNILITDYFARNLGQPLYNHSSLAVRRSFFDKIGRYDPSLTFSEDVEFGLRANLASPLAFYTKPLSCYRAWAENQITNNGIRGKVIPKLDGFAEFESRADVKKYLDFERYVLAMHCKLSGRKGDFKFYRDAIDLSNLTTLQKVMLALPRPLAQAVRDFKVFLLSKGIRWSTY
jgi:glycosyltransferase involved in cell wall biosynthesis